MNTPVVRRPTLAPGAILALLVAAARVPLCPAAERKPPAPDPRAELVAEWDAEWDYWYPGGKPRDRKTLKGAQANPAYHPLSLTELTAERDLLDLTLARIGALVEDLAAMDEPPDLASATAELAALEREAVGVNRTATDDRRTLYRRACVLRRQVALANPLLDFDEILFAKTPMDQLNFYSAINRESPHSGIFALSDFRSREPAVRDLLAGSEVVAGPHAGQTIAGRGCFADPDLDYPGRRIVFAWNERARETRYRQIVHNAKIRSPANARHVFSVGVDGAGLRQLTDGKHGDYAPCWLPNGRIAFISHRDPGANRCAFLKLPIDEFLGQGLLPYRVPRIYSMRADSTGVRRHSVHDAAEWTPSVDNDGRLIYGRWDYIDRKIDLQSFWTSYPDGRDQRSPHGNYPRPQRGRNHGATCGATYMRAIPGTRGEYVYITSSHRIYECGALLHLDLNRPDDGRGAQLREITPDLPYPLAGKGGTGKYGPSCSTPWPLSATYYLVAFRRFLHDERAFARLVKGAEKKGKPPPARPARMEHGKLGLYLLDAFGNRVLLYRDPKIDSMKPIPLKSRPRPPVLPDLVRDDDGTGPQQRASIAVMNVYESDFAWPKGTRIAALRIIQIFQNYGGGDDPPMGFTGMALPRTPLGTVPVYADGSAWFEAPVDRMLYFQALDENGLAVQSMRSGTVCHPGETLTCLGCHEDRRRAPPPAERIAPLALRRGRPDPITPEVHGSEPFTFARHVQPVLSAKCAACHVEKKKGPQKLGDTSLVKFKGGRNKGGMGSAAFASLHDYAWHYDLNYGCNDNRSVAGAIGARASKLLKHLGPAHHGVELTPAEKRRITLWMDLGSPYYVSVFDRDKQHAGELVYPRYDFDPDNPLGLEVVSNDAPQGMNRPRAGRPQTRLIAEASAREEGTQP